jgi:hypothetical protein
VPWRNANLCNAGDMAIKQANTQFVFWPENFLFDYQRFIKNTN